MPPERQFSFLPAFEEAGWPDRETFLLNEGSPRVGKILRRDALASDRYLVVTGFSSLDYLVEFVADLPEGRRPKVDVILGREPLVPAGDPPEHPHRPLDEEIRRFWLERGVSVERSGAVIRTIELVRQGRISFYILERLHAKLYVGDHHAVLGSSNFSRSGLFRQREANLRFERGSEHYAGIRRMAENFLEEAEPFDEEMQALLEQLLQRISWQESLARAAADLLEGSWIERYPSVYRSALEDRQLWPSQRQAVAQALWVLDTHGSVLIADPTGSGKTRLAVHLLYSLLNRLWSAGRGHRDTALIVAPPQVEEVWEREIEATGYRHLETVSRGILSTGGSESRARSIEKIRSRNVLIVDEAHSFLNRDSMRSEALRQNLADHVVLLTATPINRGPQDILRLVELLGLDNLSEGDYRRYSRLSSRSGNLSHEELGRLRRFIEPFTVRRTRRELNRMVDREPDAYRNREGKKCRYPEHVCKTYATGETEEDRAKADRVRERAQELRGLLYLRSLHVPPYLLERRSSHRSILRGRLRAAAALARYNVTSNLRSSRAALIEHVLGTAAATDRLELPALNKSTGNVVETLESFGEEPVATNLKVDLPDWLSDPEAMREAAREERTLYREIAELTGSISEGRRQARADRLEALMAEHDHVIAFDGHLISLYHLQDELRRRDPDFDYQVVTGQSGATREQVKRSLRLGGEGGRMAALCSDSMSEGLNLQRASAVLFLDMPTVIRLAEQRVGRVDRMDSPHEAIEVFWPKDSPEFTSRTDRKFVERYRVVEHVLGTNMPLPDELLEGEEAAITAEWMIERYEERKEEGRSWDGIEDAFQPVREMVRGEEALVAEEIYEGMIDEEDPPRTGISVVAADRPWCFLALRGTNRRAPHWVYFEEDGPIVTELSEVCEALRRRLEGVGSGGPDPNFSDGTLPETGLEEDGLLDEAASLLEGFTGRLADAEEALLPARRRHALGQMREVLGYYRNWDGGSRRGDLARRLLRLLPSRGRDRMAADLYELTGSWIEGIEPRLDERRGSGRTRRPLRIRDLTEELKRDPVPSELLEGLLENATRVEPIDRRISAAIVGVEEGRGSADQRS